MNHTDSEDCHINECCEIFALETRTRTQAELISGPALIEVRTPHTKSERERERETFAL